MRRAIYPGTFDPPHLGHLDLIERGRALVDELVVAVAVNRDKQAMFSQSQRVELLSASTSGLAGVRVMPFDGLVVDLARSEQAGFILRGIRSFSDFEAECSMALMNRQLAGRDGGETIFVLPSPHLAHYSSRWIKEVAGFGGDIAELLPAAIVERVTAELTKRRG